MKKKAKNYKDYCKEAVEREPGLYGRSFNRDGSKKPAPKFWVRNKTYKDIPKYELKKMEKKPIIFKKKEREFEITGTTVEIKEPKKNLITLEMSDNLSRQEYKRIWTHNKRVRQRIKKLKEQNGVTIKI